MKGYKIEHMESCYGKKTDVIEQCNWHDDKVISFYGWNNSDTDKALEPCEQTVAIFKIKWKS